MKWFYPEEIEEVRSVYSFPAHHLYMIPFYFGSWNYNYQQFFMFGMFQDSSNGQVFSDYSLNSFFPRSLRHKVQTSQVLWCKQEYFRGALQFFLYIFILINEILSIQHCTVGSF